MSDQCAPTQLGYIGIGVSDVRAWSQFASQILGLEVVEQDSNPTILARLDDYQFRFVISEDSADDLNLIGWEVRNEGALGSLGERLAASGIDVRVGDSESCERRNVCGLLRFDDPNGIPNEAYYGPLINRAQPFNCARVLSGFVAGDQGLGHITMAVDSLADSLHFYRDLLGLRLSDWIRPQPERGVTSDLNIAFFHCNPRHHSLAFWEMEMPRRLHHFMIQVNDIDDVGETYYLCKRHGIAIDMSLGRHTNDRMLSFYMKSPSGFDVEFGWGAIEIDEDWSVQLHNTGSIWGHILDEQH